jgi:hypothetical protein
MCTVLQYTGTGAGPFEFSICADSGSGKCAVVGAGVSSGVHSNENPIYVFPGKGIARKIYRPILGIYKSLTDT